MFIVGITGSFGTGKTSVAKFFKEFGAKVIDADKITHGLLKSSTPVYKKIVKSFGREILKNKSLEIDRRKLAQKAFSNLRRLKKLNSIIHPKAIRVIKQQISLIKKKYPKEIIVIDAPLLIEAGLLGIVDKLVVVTTGKAKQIQRIKKHKGLSEREIELRIKAQLPQKVKIKSADYLIDNNGSLTYTKKQAKKIWRELNGTGR